MRVALVDDHQLFRKGMASLIDKMEGVQLVFEASNGMEFLDRLDNCKIDLVLLDLKMPVLDGMNTLAELKERKSDIKVVFLTMEADDETILHCLEEGANGFLTKDAHPKDVKNAIYAIKDSGYYSNPKTTQVMMNGLTNWKSGNRKPQISFTEREMSVLRLTCLSKATTDIADELCLSPRTIEGYRRSLLEKIGAHNSVGLVLFATQQGWLEKWENGLE
jgi:DNA-binding NarL/FixJ family response regulator